MPLPTFERMYDAPPPWDIGRPQPDLVAVADQVHGRVLDVGCGTGEHALFYAARGCEAWGVDQVQRAIDRARAKAVERGLGATFVTGDGCVLQSLGVAFDVVVDSGFFHTLDDADRVRYVASLHEVVRPGGRVHLLCFGEGTPGTIGPRRVTQAELRAAFTGGWDVAEIVPATFVIRDPERKPVGWRATLVRAPG